MKAGELMLVTRQINPEDYSIYGLYKVKKDFKPEKSEAYRIAKSGFHPDSWIKWLLDQGFIESVDYEEFLF